MQSKVAVIIPTFNGKKFIERAIESVFNQTFRQFRIIVVDDGSTDGTAEVLDKYDNNSKIDIFRFRKNIDQIFNDYLSQEYYFSQIHEKILILEKNHTTKSFGQYKRENLILNCEK